MVPKAEVASWAGLQNAPELAGSDTGKWATLRHFANPLAGEA